MKDKKKRKKLLLSATAVLLTAALGAGLFFGTRGGGEPVNVYPFQYIGMTEFWGDMQESYGPVTTDNIQTEFLSSTQTVTEVKVKDGDMVKKGDVLFTFDTTLDGLSLERKKLDVEKIKVQIQAAEERLEDTKKLVPYVPPKPPKPTEEDLGEELTEPYKISPLKGEDENYYNGKSQETAMICWLKDTTSITDAILLDLYKTTLEYQAATPQKPEQDHSSASDVPEESSAEQDPEERPEKNEEQTYQVPGFFTCNGETVKADNMTVGKDGYKIRNSYTYQDKTYWLSFAKPVNANAVLKDLTIESYPQNDEEAQAAWVARWKDGITVKYIRDVSVTGSLLKNHAFVPVDTEKPVELELGQEAVLMFQADMKQPPQGAELNFSVSAESELLKVAHSEDTLILSGKPEKLTAEPVNYTVTAKYTFQDNYGQERAVEEKVSFTVSVVSAATKGEFYVVFKTTEKNFLKGAPTVWHGAKITAYEDGSFEITPYNASGFADHTLPLEEDVNINLPVIDPNAIYTAEEILNMQKECYAIIKEQKENLKMAEAEYSVMERELGDGNIYAEIDGKVVALLTEEEAKEQNQPLLKVSGGGGFYIEGSVSELERDHLKVGQEVTVNDWQSGGTYTGEVVSIGDFPSDSDNWNGMGNPTASYYPFKAFVGEEANLQAGNYVSMSYSTASAEQGIYLEKSFVRTEKGNSYIYIRGADGKLEKRNVRVGKVLWGSYYEILSELSEEDYLAFPYGKNVKPGAPTAESDISALYSY